MEYESVDHPPHYNAHPSGVECITIIQWFPHNIGAAVKYLWRAGLKPSADHIEDLRKAIRYIEYEIERLSNQTQQETRKSVNLAAENERLRTQVAALRRLAYVLLPLMPLLSGIVAMRDEVADALAEADRVMSK